MQWIDAYYSVLAGVILGCYSIGSCFLIKSFVSDITNDLPLLNFEATVSDGNYELVIKRFINIVREFSVVKELSRWIPLELLFEFLFYFRFVREFNGNFQYFIIVTYVWSRLTMLSSMITLHFVLVDHNTIPVELIRAVILVGWVFFAMFFICNLGQTITNEFEMFDAELHQCNWYAFPLKMQKMTLIFSSNT